MNIISSYSNTPGARTELNTLSPAILRTFESIGERRSHDRWTSTMPSAACEQHAVQIGLEEPVQCTSYSTIKLLEKRCSHGPKVQRLSS